MSKRTTLPSGNPEAVCLEYYFDTGSLPLAWSKRVTLFGSGEIHAMRVNGSFPLADHYERDGSVCCVWADSPAVSSMAKQLSSRNGRFCIANPPPSGRAEFVWERGSAIFLVASPPLSDIERAFQRIHALLLDVPDEIGSPATGSSVTSLVFGLQVDDTFLERTVACYYYGALEPDLDRFHQLKKAVSDHLDELLRKGLRVMNKR